MLMYLHQYLHAPATPCSPFLACPVLQELFDELQDQNQFGKRGEVWTLAQIAAIVLVLAPPFQMTVGGPVTVGSHATVPGSAALWILLFLPNIAFWFAGFSRYPGDPTYHCWRCIHVSGL